MGIVFWFAFMFIVFFILWWFLGCLKTNRDGLSTNAKLLKCIHFAKNFSESMYNYLVMNHMISMTSLVLYLYYEYYEPCCFNFRSLLKSLLSDKKISATVFVKLDVLIAILLILGQSIHFWRIIILVYKRRWLAFQGELDQSRVFYPEEHARLMSSGFGRAHDLEMNRDRLQQGEYLTVQLQKLEK